MIGRFASSKAGHDKDRVYVIVAQAGEYVYLSDGRLRPPEKPKKKRAKHIQPIGEQVEPPLREKLLHGDRVYAAEITHALRQYADRLKRGC